MNFRLSNRFEFEGGKTRNCAENPPVREAALSPFQGILYYVPGAALVRIFALLQRQRMVGDRTQYALPSMTEELSVPNVPFPTRLIFIRVMRNG